MTTESASLHEVIAVAIARSLRNDDVGFTGLTTGAAAAMFGTMIPLAAMEFARRTHAPDLTSLMAGWCHNPSLSQLDEIPGSEFDPKLLALPCDDRDMGYPTQTAIKRGDVTVGFSSAAQVDREGNVNTVRIGRRTLPDVQLVGPILIPEHFALFGREIVMMPRHDTRTFVEHVDHVSGVGLPGGRAGRNVLGLRGAGPEMIVTPKCIFAFNDGGAIFVRYVHPGVGLREVRESTGFAFEVDEPVTVTPIPDDEDLLILRREVDPHGLLRG